jgi:hypothetical protein
MSPCNILGNNQQEYHDGVPNGRELRKQRMQHDIYDFKGKLMLPSSLLDKSMEISNQKMVHSRELNFILVLNSQVSLPVFCYRAGDRGVVCSSLFWAWLLQHVGR